MRSLMLVSNDVIHVPRIMQEARSLVRAGIGVTALGWDRRGVHERSRFAVDGIGIQLLRDTSLMRLAPTKLLKSPLWWRAAYDVARPHRADLIHSHNLDTLRTAVRLKEDWGRPLLYDVHDIFSYMIEGDYPRFVAAYAQRMERDLLRKVDHVVTVNEPLRDHYQAITDRPVTVVMNCREDIAEKYQAPRNDLFTLLYIGNLHPDRFVLELVRVVQSLEGVRLLIGGRDHLVEEVEALCAKSPRTTFLGEVPSDRVMPRTIAADAVVCMLDPKNRNYRLAYPAKSFDAMAAGRPVIISRGNPGAELVEREGCGVPVDFTERSLKQAVEALRDDPKLAERLGRAGLAAAKREYNWGVQEKRLLSAVRSLGA